MRIGSDMDLPRHCIVGDRPVVVFATEDGGLDCQAYDWKTGDFVRAMEYLTRTLLPDIEVDVVSAEELERHVAALRSRGTRPDT